MQRYFEVNLSDDDLKHPNNKPERINVSAKRIRKKRRIQKKIENQKLQNLLHVAGIEKKSKFGKEKINFAKNKNFRNVVDDKKHHKRLPVEKEKLGVYSRGDGILENDVKNNVVRQKLKNKEIKYEWATEESARSELLLTEESGYLIPDEGEKTTSVKQSKLTQCIDITSASKYFNLNLNFGPYRMNYTRNGRHLLLGGRKGHVAAFDWISKKLHCEMNVMEEVFDVQWLHLETMFAVAQKKWVYIYDNMGIEIHCLKGLNKVLRMEFLPYHFLLATSSEEGYLSWLDVSVGSFVSQLNTKLGRLSIMTQNPYNAILCTGHNKGTVCMWSPNVKEPVAKLLCHKTALSAIAVDTKGLYLATSAVDRILNIWDIRNLNGPLQKYSLHSIASDLSFSQKGCLSVSLGNVVEVYDNCCTKTAVHPYMRHRLHRNVENAQFCPYEDVLGIGHHDGYTSILVPGSGEANIDALECNPFQTKKQRQEAEVKALLEKIQPELITLDPFDIIDVDVPTLKEKVDARNSLMHLKPAKIDFVPRRKKRSINPAKVKQIVREQAIKESVRNFRNMHDALQNSHRNSMEASDYNNDSDKSER